MRLLLRAGSLHLDRTGDLEAAARNLNSAVEVAPRDPTPLQRLVYVYEAMGKDEALVGTLRQLAELTLDAQGQAEYLSRIGWLLQSHVERRDDAIAAYREALKMVPGYLPAVQALGTLYRQQRDYDQLLESLSAEAEGPLSSELRALRFVEMAELLRGQLGRPDDAAKAYRRALELRPGMPAAFWGLRQILQEQQQYTALADLLAAQATATKDNKTRQALRLDLGQLQAHALAQPDRAIATLTQGPPHDRNRSTAVTLMQLYERTQRHAELADLLLREAQDTDDPTEAKGWRLHAAHLLEFELDEQERALAVHKEILAQEPRSAEAIRAAGRLHHRLGHWRELIDLYQHELRSDPERPDKVSILCRIGRVFEQCVGDNTAAVRAYVDALSHDPTFGPALAALERLTRREQRWRELVGVLEQYAKARAEPGAAADALCRAAELADTRLNNVSLATRLLEQAVQRCPDFLNAHHGPSPPPYASGQVGRRL